MALFRSILTVGSFTMLSRIFGFIRDILLANFLGAGALGDAFVVAFRLPNLFRRLFAEGAFSAAFVPIFCGILEKEGLEKAKLFSDQAFTVLALILVIFVAVAELTMPWIVYGLAAGFEDQPGKMELAIDLSRIAFPYLFFISLVSLQSGVLNSLGRFAAAAAAPILLNITLITAILGFAERAETAGHALSWGVFAAGFIQLLWLGWHCHREGMPVRLTMPRLSPEVRMLGKRILPVVFGVSLYQINLVIGTFLASWISDGAISYLYYADRMVQLPLGVVGVAVGTALLPMLSRQIKSGDDELAMHSQNRGLEFAFLLTLPAMAALIVIREPLINVLFERGAFDAAATAGTASALWAYAIGLPAYVMIKSLTPGFFARDDTATPVRIAAVALVANIILNLILMQFWGHLGIALGAALSAWINALALWVLLSKRGFFAIDQQLKTRLPRIFAACIGMAVALYFAQLELSGMLAGTIGERVSGLAMLVIGGGIVYGALAQIFGAARLQDLRALLRRS